MDLQDANWARFCRYHVGDWYGLWTPYMMDGVALTPRQCIRRFQRTADGRAIAHQHHYRSADGRQETTTFGPYTSATTRGMFVEASFSWGAPAVAGATPFAFETGFRAAERRVSLVARSDAHGVWQPLVVITEHLGQFAERQPAVGLPALPQGCRGHRRTITPDLRVSTEEPILWRRLEEEGEDRLTVRVPDGLAVSLPRRLAPGQPWVGIVEWAVEVTTVHRGIRTCEATEFAQFSLDQFTTEHQW
jgi:Domain of unknown function (DUF3598), N-terminal